jgi:CxxC motif-containing protein (DUF1111 family)
LWHGGEAQKSKQGFLEATSEERDNLINFINSL